jgi:hypothetical protein
MMKKNTCINHSTFSLIAFFQKMAFISQFVFIRKNLHQSRAGIGNKLKTHKFILKIAQIINKNTIHSHTDLLIKSTIQIGQLICAIASSLCFGFSGAKMLFQSIFNHLNVSSIWL